MTATPAYTYANAGNYDVRLRVTDVEGLSAVASTVIHAGNTPPVPTIDTPATALRWAVGQTITFSGRATDREQGAIPASALSWTLIRIIARRKRTVTSIRFRICRGRRRLVRSADHEYPSHLVMRLRATDSGGLQATTTIRLDPQSVDIGFQTNPTGLQVGIGSESVTATPRGLSSSDRARRSAHRRRRCWRGITYVFTSWSDGGAQTHAIVAGLGGTTFTANFARAGAGLDRADRVIHAARATARVGNWQVVRDSTAAGLARMEQPNAGAAKDAHAALFAGELFRRTVPRGGGTCVSHLDPRSRGR